MPTIVRIGLDAFHDPRGADLPRTWDEAFDSAEALQHVRIMLDRDRTVLVEGAICWPTAELCGAPTKYLYLKRMQFPDFWADQYELREQLHPDLVLRASIRDSQVARHLWERADLVIERLVGPTACKRLRRRQRQQRAPVTW